LPGPLRIARHIWRLSFSLVWGLLAVTDKIIELQGRTIETMGDELPINVAVPTLLVLLLMVYWIARVMYFSSRTFAEY
jgi:hypothetical protein